MSRWRTYLLPVCTGVLMLSAWACTPRSYFQEVREISGQTWAFRDTLQFQVHIPDTTQPYNLYVHVRNGTQYAYSNLWVFVHYAHEREVDYSDTVECPLALPNGRWLGTGAGGMVSNRILFRKGYRFPKSGEYTVTIQHGMRPDDLNNIVSVGLEVQEVTTG